jgi:cyclophilin family peptidyl-prolyl cis-trans isomerase
MSRIIRLLPLLLALALAPLTSPAQDASGTRVRISTSLGSFVVQLDTERAPLTTANFLKYVRAGFYDGTVFHRVVENFVVQGGGYTADYKAKPALDPIANESGNGLSNRRGTVGLARTADPHTGNAQFYINLVDNAALDPQPSRWGYAVFGRVIQGMEVVDRIGHAPTGPMGELPGDAPLKPVVIEKAEVLP